MPFNLPMLSTTRTYCTNRLLAVTTSSCISISSSQSRKRIASKARTAANLRSKAASSNHRTPAPASPSPCAPLAVPGPAPQKLRDRNLIRAGFEGLGVKPSWAALQQTPPPRQSKFMRVLDQLHFNLTSTPDLDSRSFGP
jgi:hypothetical protein